MRVGEITSAASGGFAGEQVLDFNSSLTLDSTTLVELAAVDITTLAATPAVVTAHIYLERAGSSTGRCKLSLRLGSCDGTFIGFTMWRPPTSSDSWVADTLTITGFAPSIDGAETLVFCGQKHDVSSPDAIVGPRGLIARW